MNKNKSLLGIIGIFAGALLIADPASATTLGGVIENVVASSHDVPGVLTGISYLTGLLLGIWAIFKLRDHVENPNQVQIWDPIKRFAAGGAFFALPTVLEAAYNTVSVGLEAYTGSSYNAGGASGGGLDAMMVALVGSVWKPSQMLFFGFCYLAGFILIIIGISRMLKTEQEGARGPTGIGTLMTFLVAGALLSIDKMLGATNQSIFGAEGMNNGALAYTAGMNGAEVGHANAVIAAAVAFIAIVGWVSFIRGFFIMRSVAEGNSQASMMAGMTHILGGAIAVNLGAMIQAVQETLGITDYGIIFS